MKKVLCMIFVFGMLFAGCGSLTEEEIVDKLLEANTGIDTYGMDMDMDMTMAMEIQGEKNVVVMEM